MTDLQAPLTVENWHAAVEGALEGLPADVQGSVTLEHPTKDVLHVWISVPTSAGKVTSRLDVLVRWWNAHEEEPSLGSGKYPRLEPTGSSPRVEKLVRSAGPFVSVEPYPGSNLPCQGFVPGKVPASHLGGYVQAIILKALFDADPRILQDATNQPR